MAIRFFWSGVRIVIGCYRITGPFITVGRYGYGLKGRQDLEQLEYEPGFREEPPARTNVRVSSSESD